MGQTPSYHRFVRPPSTVFSVAFSPDGRRLASASDDRTLRIWDARPVTPETRVFDYALSRVRFFFDHKKLSYEDALQHIREDRTISEPVRQKALQLAQRETPPPPSDVADAGLPTGDGIALERRSQPDLPPPASIEPLDLESDGADYDGRTGHGNAAVADGRRFARDPVPI